MSTTTQTSRWFGRVKRAFRKRWLQVCIVLVAWLLVVALSARAFGPKEPPKGGTADTGQYKFLHCDQCKMEMPYNKELEGKRCSKCQPPKTGFYVPSEHSIKSGLGAMSPWSKVYIAAFVETVLMLAAVTFLLYRPVPDPTTVLFVVTCPNCGQRLRYRAVSHGGLGSCSRCKRMFRFPDEEDAVSEAALMRAEEEAARARMMQTEADEP